MKIIAWGGRDATRSEAEYLGAAAYERNSERTDYRSGYRPRLLKTRVGTLELMVPQARDGFGADGLEPVEKARCGAQGLAFEKAD